MTITNRAQHTGRRTPGVLTVWRSSDVLQVGVDCGDAFLVTEAPEQAPVIVEALASRTSPDVVKSAFLEVDPRWIDRVVADLERRGRLAAGASVDPTSSECEVAVVGAGVLARQLVRMLLGETNVWLCDTAPAEDAATRTERRARWRSLASGRPGRLRLAEHWYTAVGRPAALVVVCPTSVEADRALTDQLVRDRQPHLVVTADAERGVVGPLVVPGLTPCLRCGDLARRDSEPGWPGLVTALGRTAARPSPLTSQWAAVTAAAQTLAFLGRHQPETAGGTLELSAGTHALETRSWAHHAACGCTEAW